MVAENKETGSLVVKSLSVRTKQLFDYFPAIT